MLKKSIPNVNIYIYWNNDDVYGGLSRLYTYYTNERFIYNISNEYTDITDAYNIHAMRKAFNGFAR